MKEIQFDPNGWLRYFLNGAIFVIILWELFSRAQVLPEAKTQNYTSVLTNK